MNLINFNRLPRHAAWNDLLNEVFHNRQHTNRFSNKPAINIRELKDGYAIELAAPGLKKEDFEIKVEKDQLLVTATKKEAESKEKENFKRKEFNYLNFKRSFHLPETLDADKIEASYEAGILTLTVPKKEEEIVKAKVIAVS